MFFVYFSDTFSEDSLKREKKMISSTMETTTGTFR